MQLHESGAFQNDSVDYLTDAEYARLPLVPFTRLVSRAFDLLLFVYSHP